jgi:hypothetical protein
LAPPCRSCVGQFYWLIASSMFLAYKSREVTQMVHFGSVIFLSELGPFNKNSVTLLKSPIGQI